MLLDQYGKPIGFRPRKQLGQIIQAPAIVGRATKWDHWGPKMAKARKEGVSLWAGAGDRTYAFDANMGLSDGASAYTATGWAYYQGSQAQIDLGGNQNITWTLPSTFPSGAGGAAVSSITPQQARIDAVLVIDVYLIKTSAGNELYKLYLLGCNAPAFTSNVQQLGMMSLGTPTDYSTPVVLANTTTAVIGGYRFEIPFTNEQNSLKYEFLQLYHVISGTSPTITYRAFVAVLPEP